MKLVGHGCGEHDLDDMARTRRVLKLKGLIAAEEKKLAVVSDVKLEKQKVDGDTVKLGSGVEVKKLRMLQESIDGKLDAAGELWAAEVPEEESEVIEGGEEVIEDGNEDTEAGEGA